MPRGKKKDKYEDDSGVMRNSYGRILGIPPPSNPAEELAAKCHDMRKEYRIWGDGHIQRYHTPENKINTIKDVSWLPKEGFKNQVNFPGLGCSSTYAQVDLKEAWEIRKLYESYLEEILSLDEKSSNMEDDEDIEEEEIEEEIEEKPKKRGRPRKTDSKKSPPAAKLTEKRITKKKK